MTPNGSPSSPTPDENKEKRLRQAELTATFESAVRGALQPPLVQSIAVGGAAAAVESKRGIRK
jgi:hypothetical protein